MKRSLRMPEGKRTVKLVLIGAVLLLFGCQSLILDPRGHVVPEEKWIGIPDSGEATGVFQNEDLTLAYRLVRAPGQLWISGKLRFTDRIAKSFPIVWYFNLSALLLDDQGKILEMPGLASTARYRTQEATVPDYPLAFNTPVPLYGNTRFIAFSYTGKAIDPSEPDGGSMDFWEYPMR